MQAEIQDGFQEIADSAQRTKELRNRIDELEGKKSLNDKAMAGLEDEKKTIRQQLVCLFSSRQSNGSQGPIGVNVQAAEDY